MSRIAIAAAKAKRDAARAALTDDLAGLKAEIQPARLAQTAAQAMMEQARGRPAVIAGAAMLFGLTLAVPQLRRQAAGIARFAWRNRAAISGLMAMKGLAASDRPASGHGKDMK